MVKLKKFHWRQIINYSCDRVKMRSMFVLMVFLVTNHCFILAKSVKSVKSSCHNSLRNRCKLKYMKMELWCDQSNFTTIPDPDTILGYYAPPQNSYALYLNKSCVHHFSKRILSKFTHLDILDLRENFIEYLPKNIFQTLDRLEVLKLSKNKIRKIDRSSFKGLCNLTHLYLDHNQLRIVTDHVFSDVTNLKVLKLNNNHLTSISFATFPNLNYLIELDLKVNELKSIGPSSINGLSNLKILNLAENRIEGFDVTIASMPYLKEINLSNNSIQCLDHGLFENNMLLSVIILHGNKLETPKASWFQTLTTKKEEYGFEDVISSTSNNNWDCNCDVEQYRKFLIEDLRKKPHWKVLLDVECQSPKRLQGQMLSELSLDDISPQNTCVLSSNHKASCPFTKANEEHEEKEKDISNERYERSLQMIMILVIASIVGGCCVVVTIVHVYKGYSKTHVKVIPPVENEVTRTRENSNSTTITQLDDAGTNNEHDACISVEIQQISSTDRT